MTGPVGGHPEVGQRWKHRTTNPADPSYGRIVKIVAVGHDFVRVEGQRRSTWYTAEFLRAYIYLDTPVLPPEPFEQLALDLEPLAIPVFTPAMSIQDRFEAFHQLNPWVLRAYEKLTADWIARGGRRVGIKMLTEIIRWQYGRQTTGADFKINNNYPSRYVRLLIDRNPGWADVFETRKLRSE